MFSPEQLEHFHIGFDPSDLFGKGRMKELIFDYRSYIFQARGDIELWRSRFMEQSKSVDLLVQMNTNSFEDLKAENEKLKEDLAYATATVESLTKWAGRLEKILNENGIRLTGETGYIKEETA